MALGTSIRSALRSAWTRLYKGDEDQRLREIANFLAEVPLFAPLTSGMLTEVAEAMHERRYRRDEHLYYQGDPGIGLYVVRRGCVRLLADSDDDAIEIGQATEHMILGASCLLGGGALRRTESAQASADTVVLGLFSPEYRTLQRRHPKTGAALATILARHFALSLDVVRERMSGTLRPEEVGADLLASEREALDRMTDLPTW